MQMKKVTLTEEYVQGILHPYIHSDMGDGDIFAFTRKIQNDAIRQETKLENLTEIYFMLIEYRDSLKK
jgi:hypothetical protein